MELELEQIRRERDQKWASEEIERAVREETEEKHKKKKEKREREEREERQRLLRVAEGKMKEEEEERVKRFAAEDLARKEKFAREEKKHTEKIAQLEELLQANEDRVAAITDILEEKQREERKKKREEEALKKERESSIKDEYFEVKSAAFSQDYHRFMTRVDGFEEIESENKKDKHVVFKVVVNEYFDKNNYLAWTVDRRFSDFKNLHEKLKTQFTRIPVPNLPSKGLVKGKDFLVNRQKGLDDMLAKLVATEVFQIDCLHEFLDLGNPGRAISMHAAPARGSSGDAVDDF